MGDMNDHGQADERRVATQQGYGGDVVTRWVDLEDGDGSFEVVEVPPLRLLQSMSRYGIGAMLGGGEKGDVKAVLRDGDLSGFIRNLLLPNIRQPRAYWDEPEDVLTPGQLADLSDLDTYPPAERHAVIEDYLGEPLFDLTTLSPTDLNNVITGLSGRERDDLARQMDEQFRG